MPEHERPCRGNLRVVLVSPHPDLNILPLLFTIYIYIQILLSYYYYYYYLCPLLIIIILIIKEFKKVFKNGWSGGEYGQ